MPRPLHFHLKHGLDFDEVDPIPDEVLEHAPGDHYNPARQAAKRRRVEAIANNYLHRGNLPLILSSTLKGPFDNGWKNPWVSKALPQAEEMRKNSARVRQQRKKVKTDMAIGRKPSTSLVAGNDEDSVGTEFFSVNTEEPGSRTPGGETQWLRRSAPRRQKHSELHANVSTDGSPLQSRQTRHPTNSDSELRLSLAKDPLVSTKLSPTKVIAAADVRYGRSSRSTSMVISSQPKHHNSPLAAGHIARRVNEVVDIVSHSTVTAQCVQHRDSLQPIGQEQNGDTATSVHSQADSVSSYNTPQNQPPTIPMPSTVLLQDADGPTVEGLRAARRLARLAIEQASSPSGPVAGTPPTSEPILQAALQCGRRTPKLSLTKSKKQRESRGTPNSLLPNQSPHAVPVVSTLGSNSFNYKKVGLPKAKGKNGPKSKPRAVDFSSPAVIRNRQNKTKQADISSSVEGEARADIDIIEDGALQKSPSHPATNGTVVQDETMQEPDDQEPQEYPSSRPNSIYSTQAARNWAQQDFQAMSFETPHSVEPQRLEETIDGGLSPPSATPFRIFNAKLKEEHPPLPEDSVLPRMGMEEAKMSTQARMSTQELCELSPFAQSTVKKAGVQRGSGLKYSVSSNGGYERGCAGGDAGSHTPCTERIPLKVRNSKVSFRSTASEKGSQEGPFAFSMASGNDHLDFCMSLERPDATAALFAARTT